MSAPEKPSQWIDLLDPTPEELTAAWPWPLGDDLIALLCTSAKADDLPRPRMDIGHGVVLGVLLMPSFVEGSDVIVHQEVDLVLTADAVLTVRKSAVVPAEVTAASLGAYDVTDVDRSLRRDGGVTPGRVALQIVDDLAESFLDLIDEFIDRIDTLEDRVDDANPREIQHDISRFRHDLLHLRRIVSPSRDAVRRVVDGRIELDGNALFPRDLELAFADVYDKLLRAGDALETARELLGGVRDYVQAKVSNDQNEIMKRLTVAASVLLLPTFIVGLYGQNFTDMPELGWGFGYWYSWGLIVALTAGQLWWFRRKHWI